MNFDAAINLIHDGGMIMWPLVMSALVLWYLIGLRLMTLRKGFVQRVIERAKTHGLSIQHDVENIFRGGEKQANRYDVWIRSIVICAPLAGLLGTVDGMIETFDALGEMSLYRQSGGVAGGISQALITTQMGLAVAIPGMLVGRILDRRSTELVGKLNRALGRSV